MDSPLISHPATDSEESPRPHAHLTDEGHLRLSAHNRVVSERARRLFGPSDHRETVLDVAAKLHDFGKATPQFQAYVREEFDGPERETRHARLGALATWFVLREADVPDRDRLAATLAVARHHQALPNTARYTAETLAGAVDDDGGVIDAQVECIDDTWPEAADAIMAEAEPGDASWAGFVDWLRNGDPSGDLRSLSARETLGSYTIDSSELPANLYDRTLHYWAALTLADKSHAMALDESRLFDLETLDKTTLECYIQSLRDQPSADEFEARLDDERERARRQAIEGVHEWIATDDAIATLTLPTGLGKTFTGLSAAFELRDTLDEGTRAAPEGPTPIIYALPYTSIIEQTRDIFEDPSLWGADPEKSALTVHHYLSKTVVYEDEHADRDVSDTDAEASFLGEAWRDGTILTTFVQLFESLTGPTNSQGLKLSALDSAVVILDEPQALPKDWWDGIKRLLDLLTEEYGVHVIAMTATQPSLVQSVKTTSLLSAGLTHDRSACSLCDQNPTYDQQLPSAPPETYFERADRVQYTIDETALSHQLDAPDRYLDHGTAAERLRAAASEADSVLAIANTIQSSRALSDAICEDTGTTHLGGVLRSQLEAAGSDVLDGELSAAEVASDVLTAMGIHPPASASDATNGSAAEEWDVPADLDPFVLTLNSRFRPFDRSVIVELADRLSTSPVPFILVSTQAIEAGVDISFERLYRDIAPLDSIVQAAGRCNRSYEWGPEGGRVTIWTLGPTSDDSTTPPAHWVYQRGATEDGIPDHLRIISDVLADLPGRDGISEVTFSKQAVDVYFEQLAAKTLSDGELRTEIDHSEAEKLAGRSLIGGYPTVDVLVAVTDAEVRQLQRLTELFDSASREAYDRLDELSHLRVSVPERVVEETPTLARVDGRERGSDGAAVFRFVGDSNLEYSLDRAGLGIGDQGIHSRFTVQ